MSLSLLKKSFILLYKTTATYIIIAASLGCILAIFFLFIKVEDVEIMTHNSKAKASFFCDIVDGGNSILTLTKVTDSAVVLNYTLKKGFVTPYAGMTINEFNGKHNFSKYNKIYIRVKGTGIDNIYVHVTTKDANVKDKTHRLADRISAVNLSLVHGKYDGSISLDQFETPSWWSHAIKQSINDFGAIAWDQLMTVSIVTGTSFTLDTPQQLALYSIVFYNDYFTFKLTAIIIECLILISLFLYYMNIARKSTRKPIVITYKPTLDPSKVNTETDDALSYIHENYNDSELSLSKVAKHAGIPERIVSKSINERYQCNFRTYVNSIRIAEAERLLKNSGLSISEIGYRVGFSDPSSFSKTFKKITGSAPSELQ